MRILFAGSPDFAVPSLVALNEKFPICAVLTNPDKPVGRGRQPAATAVKQRALSLGIPVLQPRDLDAAFFQQVRALEPEVLVVVAFGRIFSSAFLELFPQGGVNLHASLLPRHRGPSPVAAAILGGDTETGVTVQRLAAKMDAGDILAARTLPLSGAETTGSLSAVLSDMGSRLLPETLEGLEQGRIRPVAQDEALATYCRLVRKGDGQVDWNEQAVSIERRIRAYDPWPRAFTTWSGQRLNLLAGGVYPERPNPAVSTGMGGGLVLAIDNRYGILVSTGGGVLWVSRLQLQAKKPLDWRSFLNGQKDFIGARLGEYR